MAENADIKELAVAAWRLEKWLDNLNSNRKMAAKSALRGIKKYISAMGIEIKDPIGSKFDPGLAVEVVNNENEDAAEDELIIIETLSPYLYQDGELLQYARVIIGTKVKEAKPITEIIDESAPEVPITTEKECKPKEANTPEDDVKIGKDDIERMLSYAKIL